jgi:hypothetical protein
LGEEEAPLCHAKPPIKRSGFFLPTEDECVLLSVKPTTFLCHQGSLEFMLYRPYSQLGGQLVANKIFISLQGITIVMNNIFHVFAIFS